jgi:hypothetical protein
MIVARYLIWVWKTCLHGDMDGWIHGNLKVYYTITTHYVHFFFFLSRDGFIISRTRIVRIYGNRGGLRFLQNSCSKLQCPDYWRRCSIVQAPVSSVNSSQETLPIYEYVFSALQSQSSSVLPLASASSCTA